MADESYYLKDDTFKEKMDQLSVRDVTDLLQKQFAINTGGKTNDGYPVIIFPDSINFHLLSDIEYQRLILYLTSVSSITDADLGFHIVIDRRKDRWNSVKTVLLKISEYFPGLVRVVYVIRPKSFLQKALSEVSNKLFKEDFKFHLIVLSTVEELHKYIDPSQLTLELGGIYEYSYYDWIQQRILLENFSLLTKRVSKSLDNFTQNINESEFPNTVDSTQLLLDQLEAKYSELKEEIMVAAKQGHILLNNIKEKSFADSQETGLKESENLGTLGSIISIERLLVQLEETEQTFDEFWQKHSTKLRQCLKLRRFEQDFRELQSNFDSHLKTISEMTEVGETVNRVDTLIREMQQFEKLCTIDIERAEEVIASGNLLLKNPCICPLDCVEPKCSELSRMSSILSSRLTKRIDCLVKCRELMERVEKANKWCQNGVDLLTSQPIEKCAQSAELAEQSLMEIQQFITSASEFKLSSPKEFRSIFQDSITPETKALVTQVIQRIDDVSLMCDKRIASLKKLTLKPKRPVQSVIPKPALPLQPPGGAPLFHKGNMKKTKLKMDIIVDNNATEQQATFPINETEDKELKAKRGHVLTELLETERLYVVELEAVLQGYKRQIELEENQTLIPVGLSDKVDVLFGNLDEIFTFHSDIFLKDLENCLVSTDLVALCFVQKRDSFYRLYSYYCQNIPRSEQFRESLSDPQMFFHNCQMKLGHKLPLAAYLLKPVQRITKYQLLLKDLLRYSDAGTCCKELQQALDCMLVVLKLVNDSMHQIAIIGFPINLSQQGELLLQGSFSVWSESKKDLRLRLKPMQRHIFLHKKIMLFCKQVTKTISNKATYHFKFYLKMSDIGLTESVKGDTRKFEIWLQGRQEVHTIQALTIEQKQTWVNEIKKVLLNQLEELKGEKKKQYPTLTHRPLSQMNSIDSQQKVMPINTPVNISNDCHIPNNLLEDESMENNLWSSDCSNSEDEEVFTDHQNTTSPAGVQVGRYVALADYCASGHSEVSFREGDILELWKVGCAGWWFVKLIGTSLEGWAPSAYLESIHHKSSRSSSKSHDRLSDS